MITRLVTFALLAVSISGTLAGAAWAALMKPEAPKTVVAPGAAEG
jgi:tripartite-type tricarboxylate transporter receptor subunit TctC